MNSYLVRFFRPFVLATVLVLAALNAVTPAPACADDDAELTAAAPALTADDDPTLKLHAPNFDQVSSDLGNIGLVWDLNYDDDNDDPISPDEELIDHFNVYCDGRLVAQVDISAVREEVYTYYDGTRHHDWHLWYDPGDRWVPHSFQVSSVAKDGTEGYRSEAKSAEAKSDVLEIVGHQASASTTSIGLEFKMLGYYNVERFDLWRSQGTTAPDTSAEPYAVIPTNCQPTATGWAYWDNNVTANATYTYTVRATDSEGQTSNFYTFTVIARNGSPSLNPPYVYYEIVNNTTPTLTFTAYKNCTYRFYRNGIQVGSAYTGTGSEKSFSDTPTVDGTYTYRVDMTASGITVRGREYTFTRNTKPATISTKPDAPTLVGRLDSQNMVTLAWTPAATGGEIKGYHIYRKDAGNFVEGEYRRSGYYYLWGLNRYLNVSADTTAFADIGIPGASDAYLGNYDLGRLSSVWWGSADAPHEYYVTAYNDYGESAPSNVVEFPYADGSAPANGDTAAPAAPTITRAWVEWLDRSNNDYYVKQGIFDDNPGYNIRVAWDEAADAAATVSSYRGTFVSGEDYHEKSVPRYGLLNGLHVQDGMSEYSPLRYVYAGDDDDFNKDFTVTMYAENEAGATPSAPVTLRVDGPPRIQVAYDNGTALVRWADPVYSTATVEGWELYKRPEHGLLSKVDDFEADTYEYVDEDVLDGWTYTYYVVAKTSEGDRQSAWATRTISKGDGEGDDVGAPTNLTAKVINGRLVLSWERPADENIFVNYYYAEFKFPDSDEWVSRGDYGKGGYEGMTIDDVSDFLDKEMQVRVYAKSYDHSGPNGDGVHAPSEPATFTITSAQYNSHQSGVPGTVSPSGEAGNSWCKITWSTSTAANKPPATEYRIMRKDMEYGVYGSYVHIGTVAAKGTGSYDYEYVDRYAENGRTYRYMVYPANGNTEALVDANYDFVTLSPTAKTHDQQVAEMVAELIAGLPAPEDVTSGDAELIGEVEAIWDGLSEEQRKRVKDIDAALPKKLSDDVQALADLELLERYADIVGPVQDLIDGLPDADAVAEPDRNAIEAARAAYDAISPAEAKRLVKAARLVAAERALASLADREAASAVAALIEALPGTDALTLADKPAVEAARTALDALSAAQKAYVDSGLVDKLSALEGAIAEMERPPRGRGAWTRLYGEGRYDTMAAIVQRGFPGTSEWAVVATGDNFPDALAASSLAGALDCPVILTAKGSLSPQARSELVRLGVENAYIIGGTGAVSREVESDIGALGIAVSRAEGANRQATSAEVMGRVADCGAVDTVVVATGLNFADALAVGPWCYARRAPILLAGENGLLSDEQVAAVEKLGTVRRVVIVGGTSVVKDGVKDQLGPGYKYERLAGANRYATAAEIAAFEVADGMSVANMAVATGDNFPDALAGAALCGHTGSVLSLASGKGDVSAPASTLSGGLELQVDEGYVLGGAMAVPESVMDQLKRMTA